jgi:hypothetical protein
MSTHKTTRTPKIKFDLFIKCRDLESAAFWKTIFESCAYGKFPKGMTYKPGILYYKKGKRKAVITHVIPDEAEKALEVIKNIFRTDSGVISVDEYTKSQLELQRYFKNSELSQEAKWKDIRAPTTKNHLIHIYVSEVQKKNELTAFEAEQLQSCIAIGLLTEKLLPEDITLDAENVRIEDIKHIQHGPNGFHIDRNFQVPLIACKTAAVSTQKSATLGWSKYVEAYNSHLKACNV